MMTTIEEPILFRLDRLDNMMRHLEEMRGCNSKSPKSSCSSTPSSGTVTSMDTAGHVSSSLDFSPKSFEKHCCPIDHVIKETEVKGTLIERLNRVEDRLLELEKELEVERSEEIKSEKKKASKTKNGLRQLVKKLVKRSRNHKSK